MNRNTWKIALLALVAGLVLTAPAWAVDFSDPTGDDNGPGTYVYPTDAVYTAGSFDLTELSLTARGNNVNVEVSVNANLDDPWSMKVGFAIQMVFVFIDNADGGHTEGLPGLNIQFAESDAWDKVIILSPQSYSRVKQEIEAKVAPEIAADIVVPNRVRGSGRTISATVKAADLGEGDLESWGYQVVMQSNEGFPAEGDLLTRKVNEFEGQHRFGGGSDYDCDPHVMDILGDDQAEQLAYECGPGGEKVETATLHMVRK